MRKELEYFVMSIKSFNSSTSAEKIDYFVYYLTIEHTYNISKSAQIKKCFEDLSLTPYSNIPSYLSHNSIKKRGASPKFIKKDTGYRLERTYKQALGKNIDTGPARTQLKHSLNDLMDKITDANEKTFLKEIIDCYEFDARRAAIVMTWILSVYHLYRYVLNNKLTNFNTVLANNKDKRIKIKSVSKIDDFSEIPEGKFIEFSKSANVISGDVKKILFAKLDIRNTYAHPSNVKISQVKVTDFITDLIENVVLKY